MATEIWVNIGSGNGLLPDGTKPLPEPMLTDHQWSPVTFIPGQFHKRCLNHQSFKSVWKLHIWNFIQISQGPMSQCHFFPQFPSWRLTDQLATSWHSATPLPLVLFINMAPLIGLVWHASSTGELWCTVPMHNSVYNVLWVIMLE